MDEAAEVTLTPAQQRVQDLVAGAMRGMHDVCAQNEASADEVVSACITICARAVKLTKDAGGNMAPLKQELSSMLLQCIADTARGH